MKPLSDRQLGMHRAIPRRDFLNGVAVGIAGAGLWRGVARAQTEDPNYPPTRSGLRGQHPEAISEFDKIRQGAYGKFPVSDSEIQERVRSGHRRWRHFRPLRRLLLANGAGQRSARPDSGQSRRFRGSCQAQRISLSRQDVLRLRRHHEHRHALSIQLHSQATVEGFGHRGGAQLRSLRTGNSESKYNLGAAMFFDKENFLEDRLVPGNQRQPGFFDKKVPLLSEAALQGSGADSRQES